MIVARLSYEADERDLERHFSRFGLIERVRRPARRLPLLPDQRPCLPGITCF